MKRLLTVILAAVFACLPLLEGATAETAGFTGRMIRFDVTAEEFEAMGADLYGEAGERFFAGTKQMRDFPLVPECIAELLGEFTNNSSRLERDEYSVRWHTEALKAVYDERLIGARVSVGFGSEGKTLEQDQSWDAAWRDGETVFSLPEGYSFEDISSLRITYETGSLLDGSIGNAMFDLAYEVSGGRVTCREIGVIMENIYCYDWHLLRTEDGRLLFSVLSEDLATDASISAEFDVLTGKYLLEDY